MSDPALVSRKADDLWRDNSTAYSICTIVTQPDAYLRMVESFKKLGFGETDCEFLYLDNTKGNKFEAYAGYNLFLNVARGAHVILCHQDLILIDDGRSKLDATIEDLNERDPSWAVCGNGGGEYPGQLALRITDPHGNDQKSGNFPVRVQSLDENFIVVKKCANLALSRDLKGFHLYGTDICIIADVLGWSSYVVDFHLRHISSGSKDTSFFQIRKDMIRKYGRAFRSRWVATTNTILFLSGNFRVARALSAPIAIKIARFLGEKWPRIFSSK